MKKKKNTSDILLAGLLIAIAAVFFVYNVFYSPNEEKYESYLNVFEEVEENITTISINSINHNVVIKKSTDSKVRIGYYQKLDNSNIYTIENGKLTLKISERCEDINNLFFKSENKINTVTIYIPDNARLSVDIYSIDGSLEMDDVEIGKLDFSTINGTVRLSSTTVQTMNGNSNSGNVTLDNVYGTSLNLTTVSGRVSVNYEDTLKNHRLDLETTYGTIKINNDTVYIKNEDGSQQMAHTYLSTSEQPGLLTVRSTRSTLVIKSVEIVEEDNQIPNEEKTE